MNKQKALKYVNLALIVLFVAQAVTGVLAFTGLLAGAEFAEELHEYAGLAMVITVLIHLWLNWGWVKVNYFKMKNQKQQM
jgi:hypothetical protein